MATETCIETILTEKEIITNEKIRWENRRRMAWLCLISMIVLTFAITFTNLVSEKKLQTLSDIITWFYFSMVSIIGFYIGATTWAAVKKA